MNQNIIMGEKFGFNPTIQFKKLRLGLNLILYLKMERKKERNTIKYKIKFISKIHTGIFKSNISLRTINAQHQLNSKFENLQIRKKVK
jgi:hypothetical protein